jgi:hypothetical protein
METIFDIFEHFDKIISHKKSQIVNKGSYIDFRTSQSSSGLMITLPTQPGLTYIITVAGQLKAGDHVFLHLESNFYRERIIERSTSFKEHNTNYEFLIQFQAQSSLIDFGLLSWSDNPSTHLKITKCSILQKGHVQSKDQEELSVGSPILSDQEEDDDQDGDDETQNTDNEDETPNNDELPELLPSQFIIPADLYDESSDNLDGFVQEETNKNLNEYFEENKKIENKENKKIENKENKKIENKKIENKNKENKNKEIGINKDTFGEKHEDDFEIDEDDLYESGRQIDLDEDIKLADLGFSRIRI